MLWILNQRPLLCISRVHPWMLQCSAAACGVPLEMTWTRWWSTVCCLSSTSVTGSCSPKQGRTAWVSLSAAPLTHHHPLYTMSFPLGTGKELSGIFYKFAVLQYAGFIPDSYPFFTRFEMQDTGVTNEATLKNFSLVPYFLNSCQTEAALSVPA